MKLTVNVACPFTREAVPKIVAPSLSVALPVGTAAVPRTESENVTGWFTVAGFGFELTVIETRACATVIDSGAELAA